MSTPGDRWARVQEVFWLVRARPPSERPAFLAQIVGEDRGLAREVHALLEGDTAPGTFEPPEAKDVAAWGDGAHDALLGTLLGSCRLERRIGRGGMGVVYEAVQEGTQRRVAVKVLRSAWITDTARARFEQEARILGLLQHPAVAQIYEAGTFSAATGERLPYLVMELVPEARNLVEHVRAAALPRRERVALLATVCDAVHAGHQRGIVHRDLKPSNVLVGTDGAPKVIDFGVARLERSDGLATAAGSMVGTPAYMAPEQVAGRPDEVDTRTDVFALGLIAHEVLLDRPARDIGDLSITAALDRVRDGEAVAPSRVEPGFPRDLEAVLRKAVAREPAERYASAADFAADLRRWLASEPVLARPPGLLHAVRLFARRRRALFASVSIAALALIAATVVSLLFAAREARQRRRAEKLLSDAAGFVPWVTRDLHAEIVVLPGSMAARERLVEGVRRQVDALAVEEGDAPAVRQAAAAALAALGDVEGSVGRPSLGRHDDALREYGRALALLEPLIAEGHGGEAALRLRADVLRARGSVYASRGDLARAKPDLDAAVVVLEHLVAAHPEDAEVGRALWDTWTARGHASWYAEKRAAALEDYQRTLDSARRAIPTDTTDAGPLGALLQAYLNVGTTQLALGRLGEGLAHLDSLREVAGRLERAAPVANTYRDLFQAHLAVGDAANDTASSPQGTDAQAAGMERALASFGEALRFADAWAAQDPKNALPLRMRGTVLSRLADIAVGRGRWGDALGYLEGWMVALEANPDSEDPATNAGWDLTLAERQLGMTLASLGRAAEARPHLEKAVERARRRVAALPDEKAAKDELVAAEKALAELR